MEQHVRNPHQAHFEITFTTHSKQNLAKSLLYNNPQCNLYIHSKLIPFIHSSNTLQYIIYIKPELKTHLTIHLTLVKKKKKHVTSTETWKLKILQ